MTPQENVRNMQQGLDDQKPDFIKHSALDTVMQLDCNNTGSCYWTACDVAATGSEGGTDCAVTGTIGSLTLLTTDCCAGRVARAFGAAL